ncbi:MAG: FeoB-associated Cys-rich membrane protein [Tissierellia bacterium]|nr:FeoB-associated Cys-rich membrane protein [Tissierellia bacterium]
MGDALVIGILALAALGIVGKMRKDKKRGGPCASCPRAGTCQKMGTPEK